MKLKIGYDVGDITFYAIANNIADAYEYIKAIIHKEGISFPNQCEALSNYMEILAKFNNGEQSFHSNFAIRIEKIDEEDK